MAKRTAFSQPVFPIGVLIPLVAILFSVTGTLIYTFHAHGSTPLIAIFNSLGRAKSVTVLFKNKPLEDCLQTSSIAAGNPATDRIVGYLSGAGIFSVDFYFTSDCSGHRDKFYRYQFQGVLGGLVICNSDTQCFFNNLTSNPSSLYDPIPSVLVQWINNAQGFNIQVNGTVQGGCMTTKNIQNETNMLSFPINGSGTFVATFYSDNTCKLPAKSFTFNSPEGTDGGFITCTLDQQCSCNGCTLVSSGNISNSINNSHTSIKIIKGLQVFIPSNQSTVYARADFNGLPGGLAVCQPIPTNHWGRLALKRSIQPKMVAELFIFSDPLCTPKFLINNATLQISSSLSDGDMLLQFHI